MSETPTPSGDVVDADALLASLSDYTPAVAAVTGTVIDAGRDVAVVRLTDGRTGHLPVSEFYPNRSWEVGRSYTLAACDDTARPLLSASRPELLEMLLSGVVPELRDGRVRVLRTARQVGIRSKIAVAATEDGVDAVGALLGRNAGRLKLVSSHLLGERIDVVAWHPDRQKFVLNALAVKPVSITADETGKLLITVPAHQLQAALGGGGLNVALTSRLTGTRVTVSPA